MTEALFSYRNRQLDIQDIRFIQELITRDYSRGLEFGPFSGQV
jgi:hypothetical protein